MWGIQFIPVSVVPKGYHSHPLPHSHGPCVSSPPNPMLPPTSVPLSLSEMPSLSSCSVQLRCHLIHRPCSAFDQNHDANKCMQPLNLTASFCSGAAKPRKVNWLTRLGLALGFEIPNPVFLNYAAFWILVAFVSMCFLTVFLCACTISLRL